MSGQVAAAATSAPAVPAAPAACAAPEPRAKQQQEPATERNPMTAHLAKNITWCLQHIDAAQEHVKKKLTYDHAVKTIHPTQTSA